MTKVTIFYSLMLMLVFSAACKRKDYNCNCHVDLPDTGSVSLDFDTTYVLEDKFKKQAESECVFLEKGESVILPAGVGSLDVDVSCKLQ